MACNKGWLLAAASALSLLAVRPEAASAADDLARWRQEAAAVIITRDDWGIAHVHGRTDADAVFGMIYAQAEDDFGRVEANYLTSLGRMAEAEGETAIWTDLRQRLYVDDEDLKARYQQSPAWLKRLMDAWADGLNYYLATHPDVKPRAITRFEPWMALSFSEGSIGGDIERISPEGLAAFYGQTRLAAVDPKTEPLFKEPTGSNGIAIGPKDSADGHALLLINPHTSFYFRSELQMSSDEGLDAYGAATWGQFFIYQGFNPHIGWMHTSSGVDNVDEFAETIVRKDGKLFYRYGSELRPVAERKIVIAYRTPEGLKQRDLHRLPHPPRADRPRGERQVDQLRHDVPADGGAGAVVPAHQGLRLRLVPEDRGAEGQLVQQHHLRRRQGRDRLSASAVRARARQPVRLYEAGGRLRSGHRLEGAARAQGSAPAL